MPVETSENDGKLVKFNNLVANTSWNGANSKNWRIHLKNERGSKNDKKLLRLTQ